MFESLVFLSVLVSDCSDEIGGLGDKNPNEKPIEQIINALAPRATNLLSKGVPKALVEKVIPLPPSIDGDVARLLSKPNIRFFGISDFERSRIERIEIWAFDRMPLHLATIFVDLKPTNREAVQLWMDPEYLYIALHRYYPELLQMLLDLKVLTPMSAADVSKNSFYVDELLDDYIRSTHESETEVPTWNRVFWNLASGYELERRNMWRDHFAADRLPPPAHLSAEAKKFAVPNPPNREPNRAKFDGWLASDHTALAILGFHAPGPFRGWKVSLHPKLNRLYHPAFPNLAQRIDIEQRFEISWLNRTNLIYVELRWPGQNYVLGEHTGQILIFEKEEDLPHGMEFYRLDPATGTRLTDKPEFIPLTSLEQEAKREALAKAMSPDPLPKDLE